ncbi:DNA-binding transcriptional LysR family regulator [Sphingobium xenophagum]|uniref:DNA-binding transcriptional LysR family regulator n=1 Tax=Sphingobium xenophagum TaxID=121428 RepID=A0ABU1X297_SPHXE|nr:LysR substrate-binding domain-containing protein [Sphingobium xenophagum]MDR7155708.1 DNA-binding transcriptional LysR family regulator [Sphingobium xenophagum]
MKLSNIRDILAVAETGSLRSASRKIGITQPTITRSIRDAENELGLELFTRTVSGAMPTELGRIFIRRAKAIQNELRKIQEELAQARGELTGEVSIAMSPAAAIALLPSVLGTFERKFPRATLKLTESLLEPIESEIIEGAVDFFVGPYLKEITTTALQVETLFENRRVVVGRSGHPLAGSTSLEMLRDARWVRPSFAVRRDEIEFEAIFERADLPPPNIAVQARSTIMTLLTVANSDMLSVFPAQWLDLAERNFGVEIIPLKTALHAAPICVIRRGGLPLTPLAEAVYDMIQKAGLNYRLQRSANVAA